ncbi:MAG: hypothetical protein DME25_06170 [Verrucomicrobia bacterium]|nr:MAG: hypothetical protein DME25_06170 [Verrucomicrobiota bacterium]
MATIVATTPCPAVEVPGCDSGFSAYRVLQGLVPAPVAPTLNEKFVGGGRIRLSWSTALLGYVLQSTMDFIKWTDLTGVVPPVAPPVTIEGNEFVVYDTLGPVPKYYRLFK